MGRWTVIIRRMPRIPRLPIGGGWNLLLVAGGVYFASEHERGRHERTNLLCPICLLNKIAPAPEAPGGASSAEPSEDA
jgi:hypothetical protein